MNPRAGAVPPGTKFEVDMWLQGFCEAYGGKLMKSDVIRFITKSLNDKFSLGYTEAGIARKLEVLLGISGGGEGEVKKAVGGKEGIGEVGGGGGRVSEVSGKGDVNEVAKQEGRSEMGALARLHTPGSPAHGSGEAEPQEAVKTKKEDTMGDGVEDSNMIDTADDNIGHDAENQSAPEPGADNDTDPAPIPPTKRTAPSTPPATQKKPRILRSEKKHELGTASYHIGMEGFSRARALELDQSTTSSQRGQFSATESQWLVEHYPTMRRKGGETNWKKLADCFELQFGLQRRKEVLRVAARVEVDKAYEELKGGEGGGA